MQLPNTLLKKSLILFSFLVFITFLIYRVIFIFYPHPNAAGVDNNVVYFIQLLLDGREIYAEPSGPPFSIAQYSPLYYYITAGICSIFNIGADDVLQIFEISKAVSFFLNLLLALTLFLTGKNIFSFPVIKCWFLGLFTFIFIEGNSFARPDSLEHLFFFLSLYFFFLYIKYKNSESKNFFYIVWSAIIAALALLSKQSAITLPVIYLLWLLKNNGKRKIVILSFITYAFTIISVFSILLFLGCGNAIFQNLVKGLDNGFVLGSYWSDIIVNFYSRFGLSWVLIFLFIYPILQKEKIELLKFVGFAILMQFILTNIFAFKFGSSSNYFTNWWTLLFLGIALYWEFFFVTISSVNKKIHAAVLFLFLGLKALLISQPISHMLKTKGDKRHLFHIEQKLAQLIRQEERNPQSLTVFCNLFSPDSYLNNILFREAIIPQYDVVTLASYPRKAFNYSKLHEILANGTVKVIITKRSNSELMYMNIKLPQYIFYMEQEGYFIYHYQDKIKQSKGEMQ